MVHIHYREIIVVRRIVSSNNIRDDIRDTNQNSEPIVTRLQ